MKDLSLIHIIASAAEFIGHVNDLALATKTGIFPFSQCGPENRNSWDGGILYLDDVQDGPSDMSLNDVIADHLVDSEHHDAISGWGRVLSDICDGPVTVFVAVPDKDDPDEKPYVSVMLGDTNVEIVIEDGEWYVT